MTIRQRWKSSSATLAMFAMMQSNMAFGSTPPALTPALATASVGAAFAPTNIADQTTTVLATNTKIALLRRKIKYVFVLFQENRSFDHYFGTYPGANGLFATFPGADLTDPNQKPASAFATSGYDAFNNAIINTDGTLGTVTPFLLSRTVVSSASTTLQVYPEDILSVDHSHAGYINEIHADAATRTVTKNDGYPLDEEGYQWAGDASVATYDATTGAYTGIVTKSGAAITGKPSLAAKQSAELTVAHLDCDTIPFLWQYADRFVLLDNFHQTTFGPSTPNAIAMIAGQTGTTQWALHPNTTGLHISGGQSVPNVTDNSPFPGSVAGPTVNGVQQPADPSAVKPPLGPDEASFAACTTAGQSGTAPACPTPLAPADFGPLTTVSLKGQLTGYFPSQPNLTFASLPLSFMGSQINTIIQADENPTADLLDVQDDIAKIASSDQSVNWGWYQQGYGSEPFDGVTTLDTFPSNTPHASYIVHHNGPQYFGYIGDNTIEQTHLHGLEDFYTTIRNQTLPGPGVYYVRGGYANQDGLVATDPNPNVRALFFGNDDHGSYSDSQISEASVADSVNVIAASPYWNSSAIIITYDESDGFYDHMPEAIRNWGPDHLPLDGGPRIPAIVISPYAATHVVDHVYSEHSSVIKLINTIFRLIPLANLPDEVKGRLMGYKNPIVDPSLVAPDGSRQKNLAPADGTENNLGVLLEAFDNDRLLGKVPTLPATYAVIAGTTSLPHYGGNGCTALDITPTDYPNGYSVGGEIDPPPADFNPRPTISPGEPTSGSWTP
jgi:phospholipase C